MLLKTMLPGFALAVMAVMVVANREINWRESGSGWTSECESPVCGMAEKQAEGLARLRVLSDYIRETMNLMESVIASLDEEMMGVAQELRSVVGRRCYSRTLAPLGPLMDRWNHTVQHESENIIEVTSDSEGTRSSTDMEQGSISSMSQDVGTVLGDPYSTTQYTSQSQHSSSTTYSTSPGSFQRPSSTSQTSSTSHTTASHKTGKTSHSPDVSDKYEAQPSLTTTTYVAPEQPQPEEVGMWRGGSGRWQGGGHGQGGSRGQGTGRGQSGGRGREQGGGRRPGWGAGHGRGRSHGRGRDQNRAYEEEAPVQPQGSGCRGVPAGSLHYIPGLDAWCKINCPQGNCPSTHCVC